MSLHSRLVQYFPYAFSSQGAVFSPSSIAGLERWFATNDEAYYLTTGTDNGRTSVEELQDQVGNGNATSSGGSVPYVEGSAVMYYSDYLAHSDAALGTSDFAVVTMFSPRVYNSASAVYSTRDTTGTNLGLVVRVTNQGKPVALLDTGTNTYSVTIDNVLEFGKYYIFIANVDRDGNLEFYLHDEAGALIDSGTSDISTDSAISLTHGENYYIGADRGADNLQGLIRDVMLYKGTILDATQRANLCSYLVSTYSELAPDNAIYDSFQYAWYNGDMVSTSGSAITQATDGYGNHNLTNLVTAQRPNVGATLNGYGTLDFSTHPDSNLTEEEVTIPSVMNMIVVYKTVAASFATSSAVAGLGNAYSTTHGNFGLVTYNSTNKRTAMCYLDTSRQFTTRNSTTDEQWHISVLKMVPRNNGNIAHYFDYQSTDTPTNMGQSTDSTGDGVLDALTTGTNKDDLSLGAISGISSFQGLIAECVMFEGNVGLDYMFRTMKHFQAKYGI